MIREINLNKDVESIAEIYNHYIANTVITFEEVEITTGQMLERIQNVTNRFPWLVMEVDGKIVGYAYAYQWKDRSAFKYSAEIAIYLDANQTGKGYGKMLYEELFEELKKKNVRSLIAGITYPNPESIALHEKFGFEKIGHFKEVGYKFDKWLDVVYYGKVMNGE